MKKLKPYIINTCIIAILLIIALAINNLYPFGNKTLTLYDATSQYQPMLYNFIMKIKEGILLNYTFNTGFGQPFIFNFLYYLSSPLNLIAILFKNPYAMFMSVIILKTLLTGIFTTFYASKKTDNKFLITILAITYTFSGWYLANFFQIMWLDAFMIFPLFQYGFEELINNNKAKIYIISLAYIMLSNFYIAFIICLYTLVSYLYNLILKKDKYINKIRNFQIIMFSTIISFLMSFFYIYATYDSFLTMGIPINQPDYNQTTLPFLNLIQSFFYGNTSISVSTIEKTAPNFALSILFTISLIYYFFNKKITLKDKIKNIVAFIFFIFLLYSKTLNYIINGFHVPIGYHFRYSFLLTIFLIKLFIENYKTFDKTINKKLLFINISLIIILILLYLFNDMPLENFIFNLTFIIAYSILFVFYNNKEIYKYLFTIIVIIEVLVSLIINTNYEIETSDKGNKFNTEYITYRTVNEKNYQLYDNTTSYTSFSSMQYNMLYNDFLTMGITTDNKAQTRKSDTTELFNMLFNINDNNKYLEKIYAVNNTLYTNPALPNTTSLANLNSFTQKISGINNALEEHIIPATDINNKTYTYLIDETNTYYIHTYFLNVEKISINNIPYKEDNVSTEHQHRLQLNKNDLVKITYKNELNNSDLILYIENKEKVNEVYEILKDNQIEYTTYKDNHLEGTIKVEKNQIIFTSIPYDENWHITIDGKETKPIRLLNSLMGIECNEGIHKISLKYNKNYIIPTTISVSTLIIFIIYCIYQKKKND